ncbi:tetratricopeptide repeat protein [Streptomyces sp. NPDC056192]|uniref:tetratricopeptide repeat protein n=1 Tax=Streptomyces sp. NPDC056192 TaxID=3345743 RepID=UPI0035D6A682
MTHRRRRKTKPTSRDTPAADSAAPSARDRACHATRGRDLTAALDLNPTYAWALSSRGQAHRQAGRYDQAREDLERALGCHQICVESSRSRRRSAVL